MMFLFHIMCSIHLDNFGGTYEAWRYHVAYNINDIFRKESNHFNNPRIRSRLEKLMGSNVVRITDRKYMIKLQERIKEDHLENQKKRIQEREAEEVEREKKLILEGKIPIEAAPKELKNHPVCKINQITKKILEDKKTKSKSSAKASGSRNSKKQKDLAENKTEKEEALDGDEGGAEVQVPEDDSAGGLDSDDEEPTDVSKGIMFGKDELEKLKYEAPLVKQLRDVENVEDMYKLAEEIVGPLKHQRKSKSRLRSDQNGPSS